MTETSGVIYSYKYERVQCNEEYFRESARTVGERFKDHLKLLSLFINIVTLKAFILVWTVSV